MASNVSDSIPVGTSFGFESLSLLSWPKVPYLVVALVLLATYMSTGTSDSKNLLNPQQRFYDIFHIGPKVKFFTNADEIIKKWLSGNPQKSAWINTWDGKVVLVPPHMVHEVKNDQRLSLSLWLRKAFHAHLPGFEGFQEGGYYHDILKSTCNNQLNKNLTKFTRPLADESAHAIADIFPEDGEWHAVPILEKVPTIVAKCVARVFLGQEFARNKDWIRITCEYALAGVPVGFILRLWPVSWRYILHWFLPGTRKLRAMIAEARQIVEPALEKRKQEKAAGKTDFNDSMEWFDESARGREYDHTGVQVFLSVAAIHTSTDLACTTLIRLAQNPEMIEPLREEISSVLAESGWDKSSLAKLILLESVAKESQRMKPVAIVLRRVALEDTTLSDGTFVRKDTTVAIPSYRMWDPECYENPEKWNGYRYYNLRQKAGQGTQHQLATTSVDHFGFGYGRQPCPGRFYASDLTKIMLIHFIMKYDFRLIEGENVNGLLFGFDSTYDPNMKLEFKRRKCDLPLPEL